MMLRSQGGHSALVEITLLVDGGAIPVAQLGPDFLLLDTGFSHPPTDATLVFPGRRERAALAGASAGGDLAGLRPRRPGPAKGGIESPSVCRSRFRGETHPVLGLTLWMDKETSRDPFRRLPRPERRETLAEGKRKH